MTSGQVDPRGVDPPLDVVGLTEKAFAAAVAAGLVRRAETIVTAQRQRLAADAPPLDRARLLILEVESAESAESSLDRVQTAREAVDLVPSEPPSTLRARVLAALALALALAGRGGGDAEAVGWAEEGLAMPPELRGGDVTAKLRTVLAKASERQGDAAVRPQWTTDGTITVTSAAAVIELVGDTGDLEAAIAVHDDVVTSVTALWGTPAFQARIRLTAVLLAQFCRHLGNLEPHRAALLARAASLADDAHHAAGVGRRAERGPESRAWLCRVDAELLRLHWLAGGAVDPDALVAAWRALVAAFEAYGHVFETARSRARLAAVLRASGQTDAATAEARTARSVAAALGARPTSAEVAALTGGRSLSAAAAAVLTPREAEVLTLVADGRSNGAIGQQQFISTKTASVHVSNILAKLGARTRTEAVALARRRGLLR